VVRFYKRRKLLPGSTCHRRSKEYIDSGARRWVLTYPYPPSSPLFLRPLSPSSSERPSRRVLPQPRHPFRSQIVSLRRGRARRTTSSRRTSLVLSLSLFCSLSLVSLPYFCRRLEVYPLSRGSTLILRQERCPIEANPAKNNSGPTRQPPRSPLPALPPCFKPALGSLNSETLEKTKWRRRDPMTRHLLRRLSLHDSLFLLSFLPPLSLSPSQRKNEGKDIIQNMDKRKKNCALPRN